MKLPVGLFRPGYRMRIGLQPGPLRVVGHAADLVLPDEHADAVAVGVVSPRLDLDVLADGVESSGFEKLDVRGHGCVRWRGQEPVGPPALVEGAPVKDRFAVEGEAQMTVGVLFDAALADADVGVDHFVGFVGNVVDPERQIVESRRFR